MSIFPWTSELSLCTGHKNMQSISVFVGGTFYKARGVKNVIWLMVVGKSLREQWEGVASGKGQFSLCAHVCFKYSNRLWSAVKICQIWLHLYWEAKWQKPIHFTENTRQPWNHFYAIIDQVQTFRCYNPVSSYCRLQTSNMLKLRKCKSTIRNDMTTWNFKESALRVIIYVPHKPKKWWGTPMPHMGSSI